MIIVAMVKTEYFAFYSLAVNGWNYQDLTGERGSAIYS